MGYKLLSVSVLWLKPPTTEDVAVFDMYSNELGDWIRFSPGQWFVWTNIPVAEVTMRYRAHLPGFQLIVSEVTPTAANGAAPDWIWEWLNEKMKLQLHQGFKGS